MSATQAAIGRPLDLQREEKDLYLQREEKDLYTSLLQEFSDVFSQSADDLFLYWGFRAQRLLWSLCAHNSAYEVTEGSRYITANYMSMI